MPFGGDTLVFKVGSKMFALTDIENFKSINLKCNPEDTIELRNQYFGITPGFHMNKKHWNSVQVNSDVPSKMICKLIDESYELVLNCLTKRELLSLNIK